MATGNSSRITLDETLAVFGDVDGAIPFTASEVADELDCARRTAYDKLQSLADQGELRTKKVGARGRVWWRPDGAGRQTGDGSASPLVHEQFEELVDEVDDYAIFLLEADGHIASWNRGASRIKGYDEDEIVGEHFSTFYTDEDREAGVPERNLERARERGRVEDEGWRVHADGSTFWANVTITALRDGDGEHRGFMKVTRDMTDRHAQEEQLRQEKERFEALVSEVRDYAIFLLDADGIVRTWNDGARQIKGYTEEEIVGEHVSTFYTDEDREAGVPERNLERARERGRVEDEGERVQKDGSTFWANVVVTALRDDEGDLRGFAKVTRDMTERHQYEERLRDQRDELSELNQINTVIRDIDQALVAASSRDEIEQAVCDRLAASDTYTSAWVAEYAEDYGTITPRTWAGISEEGLEAIQTSDGAADGETEKGVGTTALRTQTVQHLHQLGSEPADEPRLEASLAEGYESAVAVPLCYNEVEYGVLTVCADDESAFDQRKVAVLAELGETISHAIAAIRRKEREQTLTAIQTSTRELLHAEAESEIGDVIVETLTESLSLADAVVYHFDTTENVLRPVSSSLGEDSHAGHPAPLTAGADSPVWTSFMDGEASLTESTGPASVLGRRRTLVVPLGDHGVLAVAPAERETFDRNTRSLVALVAATAEAAFDRVESRANLRERDELLQEQNQRLQRLNQINTIIREVDQGLVSATTRSEVQRVVCERLTESERFRFAWIGAVDDSEAGPVPRAWSGHGQGYLDSIELSPGGTAGAEPAADAAATDEVSVVSNVAGDLRGGEWRKEAFSREFQSAIAVPLRYGGFTYGVLTVYADRPGVFDSMERSVFAELGQTIANAINAVETRQRLLTDKVVDLEFTLHDESASFLSRLADEAGCDIAFDGVIPLTEGEARLFFSTSGASRADVQAVLERSVAVESFQLVASRDDVHVFEAVISGSTVPSMLVEHGASLRDLTVTDDEVRVVVDLPTSADVRGFIEQFQHRYESAEFVARRERDRPVESRAGFRGELEATLTDRQLEVLKTAYLSGFFDSPRQSTGQDVADLLEVSQPTVTEHLRTAQVKLLDHLFEADRSV